MTAGSAARAWPNCARPLTLKQLQVTRTDDGVTLSYDVRFDLPREVGRRPERRLTGISGRSETTAAAGTGPTSCAALAPDAAAEWRLTLTAWPPGDINLP